MRFSLLALFVALTLFALFGGCIGWFRHAYYVQMRDARAVLAEFPEIDRVWFVTNDDVELEVEDIYFSLKDDPNTILSCYGMDGSTKEEFRDRLRLELRIRVPAKLPSYATEFSP